MLVGAGDMVPGTHRLLSSASTVIVRGLSTSPSLDFLEVVSIFVEV
jgi:hypothetical protein